MTNGLPSRLEQLVEQIAVVITAVEAPVTAPKAKAIAARKHSFIVSSFCDSPGCYRQPTQGNSLFNSSLRASWPARFAAAVVSKLIDDRLMGFVFPAR